MDYNEVFFGLGSSFKVVKNAAYGEVSGYPVMVSGNGSKRAFTITITTAETAKGAPMKAASQKAKEDKVRLSANRRTVFFKAGLKNGEGMDAVLAKINIAVRALRENGVNPPRNCAICSRDGADAFVRLPEGIMIYDAVHRECLNKALHEAAAVEEENPGSYAMGALGAFLGAIVGIIPAFIGIYALNIVSAWLFALIPIAAYYGYKLLKGKMDKTATVLSIVFSLVGLGFLLLVLDVCVNMEYGASFADAVYTTVRYTFIDFSTEYWSWISPNLLQMIAFFLLGHVFALGIVKKTNKTKVQAIYTEMETLRPIAGAEAENRYY